MEKLLMMAFLVAPVITGAAQGFYMTRSGKISFFSKTPLENIEAVNNEVSSIINTETGEIAFAILIKSFHFERALMEEHFNENYMESVRIPKSTFQGRITNLQSVDFNKNGTYPASVEGDLTIHGVKQHITSSGMITVEDDKVLLASALSLKPGDFDIQIPALVAEKIAKSIDVKIDCEYVPK